MPGAEALGEAKRIRSQADGERANNGPLNGCNGLMVELSLKSLITFPFFAALQYPLLSKWRAFRDTFRFQSGVIETFNF